MLRYFYYLLLFKIAAGQVLYDAYFGKPLTEERNASLAARITNSSLSALSTNPALADFLNVPSPCTISVKPCNKHEGRRIDGTCANPKYPPRGGSPTPLLRMFPAQFGPGNTLRPAMNGSELPSARLIRTKILSEGYHVDPHFSMHLSHILVFKYLDNIDVNYLLRYQVVSDCCLGNTPNRVNPICIPIPVPEDDPFLRRSGVRCMNLTRFITFQELGCVPNTLPAERLSIPTPLLDLSVVYGFSEARLRQIRTFRGGQLQTEPGRDGVERPPGTAPICASNRPPLETACYQFGDTFSGNTLMGVRLYALWWYREHNRIARKLAEINPCWSDDELFETARMINIAEWQHIMYYEAMATVLGRKNLEEAGVLHNTKGYVNDFNKKYKPGVFHEYLLAGRWFHTLQEGRTDIYNAAGKYLGTRTTVDDAMRSGVLENNNTEADLTQGAFRQNSARIDYNIDPDLAERLHGGYQRASDLPAIDIERGRDHGLPSYNSYRKICGMPVAHKWEDFKEIYPDKLEQLRRIYKDVDEVELMPAIYSEKLMAGSWVPPTLFCIFAHNLLWWRKSDRHFYEQGGPATPFTLPQLNEIRKMTGARLQCDNGVSVTKIQPHVFYEAGPHNKIVPCHEIPEVDLNKWADEKCHHKVDGDHDGHHDKYDHHEKRDYQDKFKDHDHDHSDHNDHDDHDDHHDRNNQYDRVDQHYHHGHYRDENNDHNGYNDHHDQHNRRDKYGSHDIQDYHADHDKNDYHDKHDHHFEHDHYHKYNRRDKHDRHRHIDQYDWEFPEADKYSYVYKK